MQIVTPSRSGPIVKEIVVGGGVRVPVNGSRFSILGEVMTIDEANQRVLVSGNGVNGWVAKDDIRDAMSVSDYAVQAAINRDV